MATPKIQEQERIGPDGGTVKGTVDRAFNGAAAVALPPLPAAPMPGSPAWWAAIRALTHYDPAYEYDDDYTTDPDYGVDGVVYLTSEPHKFFLASFKDTVEARRGRCAPREFTVHLSDAVRQVLGPDHEFRNKGHLVPDVAVLPEVFPPGEPLPRVCRLDMDPPPLLVLEVLPESTWRADLGPKRDTYAAMGIAEYWLYDPEGHAPPAHADGVAFWGWQLDDTRGAMSLSRDRQGTGNGPCTTARCWRPTSACCRPRSATRMSACRTNRWIGIDYSGGIRLRASGAIARPTRNGNGQSWNVNGWSWPSICCAHTWERSWNRRTWSGSRPLGIGTAPRRM